MPVKSECLGEGPKHPSASRAPQVSPACVRVEGHCSVGLAMFWRRKSKPQTMMDLRGSMDHALGECRTTLSDSQFAGLTSVF